MEGDSGDLLYLKQQRIKGNKQESLLFSDHQCSSGLPFPWPPLWHVARALNPWLRSSMTRAIEVNFLQRCKSLAQPAYITNFVITKMWELCQTNGMFLCSVNWWLGLLWLGCFFPGFKLGRLSAVLPKVQFSAAFLSWRIHISGSLTGLNSLSLRRNSSHP